MADPKLRSLLETALSRMPRISFFTSSRPKFWQASTVLSEFGVQIYPERHQRDELDLPEDESGTKEQLLAKIIEQILHPRGLPPEVLNERSTGIFFVEDTSIRIDQLTKEHGLDDVPDGYPGLYARWWFSSVSLADLHRMVGGNKRCSVRSAIALHLPGLDDPVFFYGQTTGTLVDRAPTTRANPFYPWLDPQTFSGWIRPDGATTSLAEMQYEESCNFDFRAQALYGLASRLSEYAAVLLTSGRARRDIRAESATPPSPAVLAPPDTGAQLTLFPTPTVVTAARLPVYLLVGRRCAGKTVAGNFLMHHLGWPNFVDASDIMKEIRWDRHDPRPLEEFSRAVLAEEPAVVASRIIATHKDRSCFPLVVTGLRTIQEVELFRSVFGRQAVVISIEAPQRLRYQRYLERKRNEDRREQMTPEEFAIDDEYQCSFGFLRVARFLADLRIRNVVSPNAYTHLLLRAVGQEARGIDGPTRGEPRERNELHRCLRVLAHVGSPMDCLEIAHGDAALHSIANAKELRDNNVNRTLKRYPELCRRHEDGRRVKYSITDSGRAFVEAFERLLERAES